MYFMLGEAVSIAGEQASPTFGDDARYGQPLMIVRDRENRRLAHMDFDGKFARNTILHLRRPCQVSFLGDHAIVSELEGRVTVLDKGNVPVAFLGDNPDQAQWANIGSTPQPSPPPYFRRRMDALLRGQTARLI